MISLSDAAITEIKRLMAERNQSDKIVRFGVETGGCSGLQYSMEFDNQAGDEDRVIEHSELTIVCDSGSMRYLSGLEVDFVDKLLGGGFRFHNPNASRTCGCGTSFRV